MVLPIDSTSLTLWVDRAAPDAWRYHGPTQQGAQSQFSDSASEGRLTLRAVYHLTLRAAEGFARPLFELMAVDLPAPDYGTPCRRAKAVRITPPRQATGPLHLILDSTGPKVHGEGEWKVRQHGDSRRRTRPKLHLAIDPETHAIRAAVVSDPGGTDEGAVPMPLGQEEGPISGVGADGAHDRRSVYEEVARRGARAVIPPRRDAKVQRHGNRSGPRRARDEDLRRIRPVGRAAWERESGCHQRSLGEPAMSRLKALFGPGVSSRRDGQRATEVGLRCRAMNIMTHQGMPATVRVA